MSYTWNKPSGNINGIPAFLANEQHDFPEIKLSSNRNERFENDNFADLFAIIVTTEHLETAYVRDSISSDEYNAACMKLIAQYRTAKAALSDKITDIATFLVEFNIQAPAAYKRLEKIGVPATVEHGDAHKPQKSSEIYVAATVQHFITTMDSLKLEMYAVDELHPNLNDLMDSLNKVSALSPEHISKVKVKEWLIILNGMKASEELDQDQARQMLFDLDLSYNAFVKLLET